MNVRKLLLATTLALPLLGGCAARQPAQAPAPGYTSTADQTLGQSLAAVNAFVISEKTNYASLTPAQQAVEKPYLNTLIDSTNVANAVYVAYHQGTATLAQAQAAYNTASSAQASLIAKKGVH